MNDSKKAQRYDAMLNDFTALRQGEEQIIILEGRAYVVKLAEVKDIERVTTGWVFVVD